MAGVKISELSKAVQLLSRDYIPIARDNLTYSLPGSAVVSMDLYLRDKLENVYSGRKYVLMQEAFQYRLIKRADNNTLFVHESESPTPEVQFEIDSSPSTQFSLGFEFEIINLSRAELKISLKKTATSEYTWVDPSTGNVTTSTYSVLGPTTSIGQYEAIKFTHVKGELWIKRYVALAEPVIPEIDLSTINARLAALEQRDIDFDLRLKDLANTVNKQYAIFQKADLDLYNLIAGLELTPTTAIPVIVKDLPAKAIIKFGSTETLKISAVNQTSFQWFKNGISISGATTDSLVVSEAGIYKVNVSNPSGTVSSYGCAAVQEAGGTVANVTVTPVGPTVSQGLITITTLKQPDPVPPLPVTETSPGMVVFPPQAITVDKPEPRSVPPAVAIGDLLGPKFDLVSLSGDNMVSLGSNSALYVSISGELVYPNKSLLVYLNPNVVNTGMESEAGAYILNYGGTLSDNLSTTMYTPETRELAPNFKGIFRNPIDSKISGFKTDDLGLFSWYVVQSAINNGNTYYFYLDGKSQLETGHYLFKLQGTTFVSATNLVGTFTHNSATMQGFTSETGFFTKLD